MVKGSTLLSTKALFGVFGVLAFCVLLAPLTLALSPTEAIDYVSKKNNFLESNEQAAITQPQVTISYKSTPYWIVTAIANSNPTAYFPINTKTNVLASGDIEIRELIKTSITLTKMYALRNNYSVGEWPYSYSNRSLFYDMQRDFSDLTSKVLSVQTDLKAINGTDAANLVLVADDIQQNLTTLQTQCKNLAQSIDSSMTFEDAYFAGTDTNATAQYEQTFADFYTDVDTLNTTYNNLQTNINTFRQGVGRLANTDVSSTQKDAILNSIRLPTTSGKLDSFFSTTTKTRTLTESIFTSGKSIEGLVSNLTTRVNRNNAWNFLYGTNTKVAKINPVFDTLKKAADAILATENVDQWAQTAAVTSLKVNWAQAESKFNTGEYDKSKEFAAKAETNIIAILEGGAKQATDNTQQLVTQGVIVLIIIIVGLFIFDKVYWSKRKKGEEDDDNELN